MGRREEAEAAAEELARSMPLPVELIVEAPQELIADFDRIIRPEEIDTTGDGKPDSIRLGTFDLRKE